MDINGVPKLPDIRPQVWVDQDSQANDVRRAFCQQHHIEYRVLSASMMQGFSAPTPTPPALDRKKVVVTGCYDWFHSGHVRFFEEVSAYGDLYVIVGHDANIRLLKGEGHPLLSQEERRYAVGSIKYVKEALISTGEGWLDADPEIQRLRPDIYAVNEDGDKGGKREYCARLGLEYLVLRRTPAAGLQPRNSTELRGS
jgi:cytidyltransferase-like protein